MEAGRCGGPEGDPSGGADGADQQVASAWEEQCCRSRRWERAEEAAGWRSWRCSGDPRLRALSPVSPIRISPQWFSMVVRECCGLVCELQTLSSSKVISHMPPTKMHIYWLREHQHNSDDSTNVACLFYCHRLFDALLAASTIIVLMSNCSLFRFTCKDQRVSDAAQCLPLIHSCNKEGTWPSSCLVQKPGGRRALQPLRGGLRREAQ
ncbi:uncharacterized protein LOC119359487 isoform X1 [Triticum dicoccoides]|uniref:uncharacterized protein LOC119359487 isoform X1 n=1 Tax=Triticum dicoccoides TaxID=85692 RepID=UPI0018907B8F|nr:uncharacterized protein LOC119359487 isoform X1 [Triticum dicoccoides]